ncbi:C40 family peptidase [Alicyclobacillus shizuokensis]|uniref:C40 family peptidase n=1 Tax=Alicyclobacillus shizuokensis TaxID=392014 RepID=UPI00082A07E0|nr:LysM peptidoglycan-binding domain-containing protein [Alicyclobacillus shizuokensis]MCL6626003.1 LysM peptidoglycan-binding domain-containing protein [Alicyclobacillus shizuokensis]
MKHRKRHHRQPRHLRRSSVRRTRFGRSMFGIVVGSALTGTVGVTSAWAATTYKVKPGDSVWSIARRHGLTVSQLVAYNHLANPDLIYPNQILCLSGDASSSTTDATSISTSTSSTASSATTYVVRKGDTLWSIAQRYQVSVGNLVAWNSISNPNLIYPGMALRLSGTASTSVTQSPAASGNSGTSTAPTPSSRGGLPPETVTQSVSGQAVVNYAKQFVGDPYLYGGESTSGWDCSGLVQAVYAHFGIKLPRTAAGQAQVGQKISVSDLQPGDLVFFNTTGDVYSHVGIWAGGGQFISATVHGGVCYQSLNTSYWEPRLSKCTRVLG